MANSSDMNVALRFQADVSQARAELKALRVDAEAVGQGAKKIDAAPIDRLAGSAKQADTATKGMGSAAKTAAADTKSLTGASNALNAAAQAQAQAVNNAAKANQQAGISAKQHAAAMRMLPAQMTDITVGLSTGQSPFMVMMQQGGQLKDAFGGIAPAAKAVSGSVLGMVNPLTITAVAVGVLTAAWLSGRKEQEAYARALITTGNASGTSVGKLTAIASAVGEVTGSYGKASEAAAGLAGTGKVSSDVIAQATLATTAWARATDTDVGSMVQSFAALGEKPVEASRQLNEQYNYLTTSVYQQIKALEEQGRKDEAAALAQRTFANAMKDRADEVKAQLNGLGQAANWVGQQFSSMWHSISNIGRVAPLTEQLADAQKEYKKLLDAGKTGDAIPHALGFTSYDSTKEARAKALKKITDLQQQQFAEERKAAVAAKRAADADAGIKATDSITRITKDLQTNADKLKELRKKIQEDGKLAGTSQGEIQRLLKAADEKYTPKTPKGAGPRTNPVDTAYQSQLQSLQMARAQAEQGLANAEDKVGASTDQATAKLEAWLAVNKNALKLDDTRIAKLREVAAETDRLHKATKDLQETKARDERITHGMAQVEQALAQAQGRTAEAKAAQEEERWRKLRADLTKKGDNDGLVKVDRLVGIESARAQLESLQQQADRIFSDQSRTEQSLANQVTAGLTGELEAKRQILAINGSTATQIEALLPKMRELAEITGNPAAIDRIKDLEVRIQGLRTKANEVQQAFGDAFGNSLSNSLKSLSDGTATLGEAVLGLLRNLALGMGEWAAQQLALQAKDGLMAMINGAAKTAAGAGAATSAAGTVAAGVGAVVDTAGAAAETAATAASTTATIADTAATTAAAAASTAMATAATAAAVALQAVAASSAGSGASSALGALSAGFSSGGWTGPGTKFQPAGIVHADEFVHRQEVVRQPGALAFLTRFNQVGMAALKGWHGYAGGGLVVGAGASLGIPSMGNFKPATPAMGGSTTVDNQQAFYLVDDQDRIAEVLASSKGEKAMTVLLSRNAAKFRQILEL